MFYSNILIKLAFFKDILNKINNFILIYFGVTLKTLFFFEFYCKLFLHFFSIKLIHSIAQLYCPPLYQNIFIFFCQLYMQGSYKMPIYYMKGKKKI